MRSSMLPFANACLLGEFQLVLPEESVNLILRKANDYHDLCQGKPPNRKATPGGRYEKKSSEWSGQKWSEGGIGPREVLASLGLLIHVGVVKLPRMEDSPISRPVL